MNMKKDFPLKESYQSARGNTIEFEITHNDSVAGHTLIAQETPRSRGRRLGYSFMSFSPISPHLALGELRNKIRKELSTQYLEGEEHDLSLTHDVLTGRITFSIDGEEIVIEADGKKVTQEGFWRILAAYEGFEIEVRIKEQ